MERKEGRDEEVGRGGAVFGEVRFVRYRANVSPGRISQLAGDQP